MTAVGFARLAVVAASGLVAAGCSGGDHTAPSGKPATRDAAIARCLEDAKRLTGDTRKTAEAACEAGGTDDPGAFSKAARRQCLDAAENIPDPAARRRMQDRCKRTAS